MQPGEHDSIDEDLYGPLSTHAAGRLLEALSGMETEEFQALSDPELPRIGEYLISRQIGRGGGGVVYHAVRPDWNDEFAIKLLHRGVGEGRSSRRVWRELDLIEGLDLTATPRVYEYGVYEGRLYIVSEHINGRRLDQHCATLDVRGRVRVLAEVAHALAQLHRFGVIHRDIKPSNILVDHAGKPYLIDLGVAAPLERTPADDITLDGAPIGSVAFMAPEQARGERGHVGVPADIYGLGATACVILTGSTPHDISGSMFEMIQQVGSSRHRSIRSLAPDLPQDLVAILETALAFHRDDRYGDAEALAEDLERWLDGHPVQCRPTPWWRRGVMAIRRRPGVWGWSIAASVLFMIGSAFAVDQAIQSAVARRVHQATATASAQFYELISNEQYKYAMSNIHSVEIYAQEGLWPEGEPLPDFEARRDELATAILQVVYDETGQDLPPPELAYEVLEAIYAGDVNWSSDQADFVWQFLLDLE